MGGRRAPVAHVRRPRARTPHNLVVRVIARNDQPHGVGSPTPLRWMNARRMSAPDTRSDE
jgi:ribosome biogenesis protein Nip4